MSSSTAVVGNSAAYFSRSDERRLEELTRILGNFDDQNNSSNTTTTLQDIDALRAEYNDLSDRRELFVKESLEQMSRAAARSGGRVFHAFESDSSSSATSAGFGFLSAIWSTVTDAFTTTTTKSPALTTNPSSSTTPVLTPRRAVVDEQQAAAVSSGGNAAAGATSSSSSGAAAGATITVPVDADAMAKKKFDDTPVRGASAAFPVQQKPVSLGLAWSALGACALALLLVGILHWLDREHKHEVAAAIVTAAESPMSMLLRLTETSVGLAGCAALVLHLHFSSSSVSSSHYYSRSSSAASASSTALSQSPSVGVRLSLRICEVGSLFLTVFSLLYSAVLFAPLEHVGKDNLLREHIVREQAANHVDRSGVLIFSAMDFVLWLATRRILSEQSEFLS